MKKQEQELTQEIIDQIKELNPGRPIYKYNISGKDFVFSFLNRAEHRQIESWINNNPNVLPSDIEEYIVNKSLLWPSITPNEWASLAAGIIPTLARVIQEKSDLDQTGIGDITGLLVQELSDSLEKVEATEEEVEKLKSKCPHTLRKVTIDNTAYIIRPMLRIEYNYIRKLSDDTDSEVEGCKKCVLFPDPKTIDWEQVGAGVPIVLARQIMLASGFSEYSTVEEL